MDRFWVDTNVIIRFLMKDHEEHSAAAYEVMEKVQHGKIQLYLNPIVAAECCFILWHDYNINRRAIADILIELFGHSGFIAPNKPTIMEAIEALKINSRLSFEDAFIAATAKHHQTTKVLTFNQRDFQKLKSECYSPLNLKDQ